MESEVLVTLGLLLGASLMFAAMVDTFRIPKVTAYLSVGMLAGQHGLRWVSPETFHLMEPFAEMAMALVLFNLGSHFPIAQLRRMGRLLPLSFGEQLATLLIVSIGLWLATGNAVVAVLLGTLALATAPATTVLVLQEVQSRGPITELASGLVVLNNLACILLFETLLLIFVGAGSLESGIGLAVFQLVGGFLGAILLGFLAGVLVSYFSGLLNSKKWLVMVVAIAAGLLGVSDLLEVPYMLAFLTMGAIVASFSNEAKKLTVEIDNLTTLLCVVFFVYHGSELDVRSFFAAGLVGFAYIACRIAGKYLGIYTAAKLTKDSQEVRRWLGLTQLAQAGAAIALCTIAVRRDVALGRELQNVILGSVVFFEIVGPLCIRYGVLQAGELPLSQAIYHMGHTPLEQAKELWSRLNAAFGTGGERSIDQLKVADLMRRSQSITEDSTFDRVVDHIEHSHDDIFPVVNMDGVPVGVIHYGAINDVLYDPDAVELICAADLMQAPDSCFRKSDGAARVIDYLSVSSDDCVLVTDDRAPFPFLGVVRRSDVTAMLIQERKGNSQQPPASSLENRRMDD